MNYVYHCVSMNYVYHHVSIILFDFLCSLSIGATNEVTEIMTL